MTPRSKKRERSRSPSISALEDTQRDGDRSNVALLGSTNLQDDTHLPEIVDKRSKYKKKRTRTKQKDVNVAPRAISNDGKQSSKEKSGSTKSQ